MKLLRGGTQPWGRIMDTHGNIWMQPTDLDIPPAAFFEPEPTTPIKPTPETIKPTKTEPIKPEPETPQKTQPPDTPPEPKKERNVSVRHKLIFLWAKLKR